MNIDGCRRFDDLTGVWEKPLRACDLRLGLKLGLGNSNQMKIARLAFPVAAISPFPLKTLRLQILRSYNEPSSNRIMCFVNEGLEIILMRTIHGVPGHP